ncbi:LysR family transcriptional regulator [Hyphomonas sp.]|uniref:LysR family transcriptional regulator n=1 Tax=Hyphomonas sp. TaxID=87 RepID=UPI00391B7DAC
MNPSKLRFIVAVDREGSFSRAAWRLNISQSAVTKHVADVERDLGYALFIRKARETVATAAGREFLDRAARILSDLDQLVTDARITRETNERLIRIGLSPASIQGLFNRPVRNLIDRNRSLRVHLDALSVDRGLLDLRRGDLDVLIGPKSSLDAQDDLDFESIGHLFASLFVRKGHSLLARSEVTETDLLSYALISPDRKSLHADRLQDFFPHVSGDRSRSLHVIDYFPIVADIVRNSDAIGIVSNAHAQTRSFTKSFATLSVDIFDPLEFGYALRKSSYPTSAVRAFLSVLASAPVIGISPSPV